MKNLDGKLLTESESIEQYDALLWKLVHQYSRIGSKAKMDWSDLYNAGAIGLIKAYRAYDESRGVKFMNFIYPYIEGEMRKMLRDHGRVIRPPRPLLELYAKILKADMLESHPAEIAATFDVDEAEARAAVGVANPVKSMDEVTVEKDDSDIHQYQMVGETDDYTFIYVQDFLSTLPMRMREITEMKMNDLSQREIGQAVGLSQVQVSRELRKVAKRYEEVV